LSRRTLGAIAGVVAAIGCCGLPSCDDRGEARDIRASSRFDSLKHARVRPGDVDRHALVTPPPDPTGALTRDTVECQFVPRATGGTSFKFECALAGGEIVRVKYGHEPEIHAEVAATRLLTALGYATDHMYLVPRLRCHGCPANPFVTMLVLDKIGLGSADLKGWRHGFKDFEWVAVERKFEAPAIEDDSHQGWAWWELKYVDAPRDELDALRLLAVFLAHWDNKADNQRLVCLDADAAPVVVASGFSRTFSRTCREPLLMIQDLGSTFGPMKVNLSQWRETPVWIDRAACAVSMKALPYQGGTFTDARISEAARRRVGDELSSFSDAELRTWLAAARFPQYYASTDDQKDMDAWLQAYRRRVSQILAAGPCS